MTAETTHPDLLLARRAAAGQTEAWDELVSLYGRRLYNLAYQFAGGAAEAEDLTQEIFIRLYESLRLYRGDVPLIAWALRLSRNLCIDHYRHSRRLRRWGETVSDEVLDYQASGDDPQAAVEHRQRIAMVHEELAEMPEDLSLTIVLRDLQELSYEETAAALEVPLGTVKSRLNRGRAVLAQRIEDRLARFDVEGTAAGRENAL